MVKLAKWEKQALLQIHRQTRSNKRCIIVQELTAERDTLTGDIDSKIKLLQLRLKTILTEHKLCDFGKSSYGCGITEKHPRLVEFDEKTDVMTQQIVLETVEVIE
jgi:hypothetical protein